MVKRILSILALCALLLTALSACGNQPDETTPVATTPTPTTPSPTEPEVVYGTVQLQGYTLTVTVGEDRHTVDLSTATGLADSMINTENGKFKTVIPLKEDDGTRGAYRELLSLLFGVDPATQEKGPQIAVSGLNKDGVDQLLRSESIDHLFLITDEEDLSLSESSHFLCELLVLSTGETGIWIGDQLVLTLQENQLTQNGSELLGVDYKVNVEQVVHCWEQLCDRVPAKPIYGSMQLKGYVLTVTEDGSVRSVDLSGAAAIVSLPRPQYDYSDDVRYLTDTDSGEGTVSRENYRALLKALFGVDPASGEAGPVIAVIGTNDFNDKLNSGEKDPIGFVLADDTLPKEGQISYVGNAESYIATVMCTDNGWCFVAWEDYCYVVESLDPDENVIHDGKTYGTGHAADTAQIWELLSWASIRK